jgi:membrane fusion protein (multidrug efflux system)
VALGGGLAVAVAAVAYWLYSRQFESTDDAEIDGDISNVGSKVAGTLQAVYVVENQPVRAGQVLAEVDPTDLQVAVSQARARLVQAAANNRDAQREARRAERLIREHAITESQRDRDSSNASAAAAQVELARAVLKQAELNLSYTRIVTPVSGVVAKKAAAPGDHVGPGQALFAVSQIRGLWVTANFKETQLRRMHAGQTATVKVDALGKTLQGRVGNVGGATGSRLSVLPPENATGNYVKVVQRVPIRIDLDAAQADAERLRPGMSVEPKVRVR